MTKSLQNILPKPYKHLGKIHTPENTDGTFNAEITKTSIKITGEHTNSINGNRTFDRIFKINDTAVYDSWNVVFTGPIKNIGPKSVTIYSTLRDKTVRLGLFEFIRRNWDFDMEKINERNDKWMD